MAKTESTMQRKHAYAHILCIIASKMGKKSFTVAEVAEKINFPSFVGRGKSGMSPRIRSALAFGRSKDIGLVSVRKDKGKNRYSIQGECKSTLNKMFSDIGKNYKDVNSFRKAQKKMSLANKFTSKGISLANQYRSKSSLSKSAKTAHKTLSVLKRMTSTKSAFYELAQAIKNKFPDKKKRDDFIELLIDSFRGDSQKDYKKLLQSIGLVNIKFEDEGRTKKNPPKNKVRSAKRRSKLNKKTKSNPPKRRKKETSKRKPVKRRTKKTIRSVKRNPPKRKRKTRSKSSASKRKVSRRRPIASRKATRRKSTSRKRVARKPAKRRSVRRTRR